MMNFKELLFNIAPFYFARNWSSRKYSNGIICDYKNLPVIEKEKAKFKNIISVQGFGFSGSGAVVDFFREFSDCMTLGTIDTEGSKTEGNKSENGEIDILRHSGGLFEIEMYIGNSNLFIKDALMKRFKSLANHSLYFQSTERKLLVNQFFNHLIDFEIDCRNLYPYNSHILNPMNGDNNIKIMKSLSQEEYISICRRFLTSLFNTYHYDGYNYLVLDQLCNDFNYDYDHYLEYIPNLKTIVVYRDPRDIYTYAVQKDLSFIPHDSVYSFIEWFKIVTHNFDMYSTDYLSLRFEDLVLDYENQIKRIGNYVGLSVKNHIFKKKNFDPSVSAQNVKIWKSYHSYEKDFEIINNELTNFCYSGLNG